MISNYDVASRIRAYLRGELSLDSFRVWIANAHLEVEAPNGKADEDAARLLADIEGRYSEFVDGVVSQALWKQRLGELAVGLPEQMVQLRPEFPNASAWTAFCQVNASRNQVALLLYFDFSYSGSPELKLAPPSESAAPITPNVQVAGVAAA